MPAHNHIITQSEATDLDSDGGQTGSEHPGQAQVCILFAHSAECCVSNGDCPCLRSLTDVLLPTPSFPLAWSSAFCLLRVPHIQIPMSKGLIAWPVLDIARSGYAELLG